MNANSRVTGHPLRQWLFEHALPLWWNVGADRRNGGFYERIGDDLQPIEEPRRARVVGRQIYVYASAHEMGWQGPCAEAVGHGIDFLTSKLLNKDGTVISTVNADGSVVRGSFDLYDHAFVLFGLAAAARRLGDRSALETIARTMRERLVQGWSHPAAGFEESTPRSLPLKSNPHMHLLEAFLMWAEVARGGDPEWDQLADAIAELCLSRFIDSQSGALREFYDGDWRPFPGEQGRIVEPGHQFEWGWLLLRWGKLRGRPDAIEAARRLCALAERHGVDAASGVAFNELDDSLVPRDRHARLWPQTERIKAWHAMADAARDDSDRRAARAAMLRATEGLQRYFLGKPPGLWWETMLRNGAFAPEASRASSLYHITCAISTMNGTF